MKQPLHPPFRTRFGGVIVCRCGRGWPTPELVRATAAGAQLDACCLVLGRLFLAVQREADELEAALEREEALRGKQMARRRESQARWRARHRAGLVGAHPKGA